MESTQKLNGRSKLSYGLGAVGKDMVYMLSSSYILYYYQDLLGVSTVAMGTILLAARVFAEGPGKKGCVTRQPNMVEV